MKTLTLILFLIITQVKAQDCLPKLIKASKDTTFTLTDSNLLLIERPDNDTYEVTISFRKKAPVITTVNDTELTYTGSWIPASGTWGSVTYSSTVGATAKYTFTGNRIEVISDLAPGHGLMSFTIDGKPEESVNLYSATRLNGLVVIDRTLTSGSHTITFRVISNTVLLDYLRISK